MIRPVSSAKQRQTRNIIINILRNTADIAVPQSSPREEIANSVTHGIGAVLAVGGMGTMTAFATVLGNARNIVSCSIFGATLILLYTTSALYHSIRMPEAKTLLRVFDHAAVFLFIAGTYTPFAMADIRGPVGWCLFGIVWAIALLSVIFQTSLLQRWPAASVGLYTGMCFLIAIAIKPLLATLTPSGLILFFAGGFSYILGLIFFAWHRLPYHHAVWHLFVLTGSFLHFFAILFYIIPAVP